MSNGQNSAVMPSVEVTARKPTRSHKLSYFLGYFSQSQRTDHLT
jgi:hypothetical protein